MDTRLNFLVIAQKDPGFDLQPLAEHQVCKNLRWFARQIVVSPFPKVAAALPNHDLQQFLRSFCSLGFWLGLPCGFGFLCRAFEVQCEQA